jgi:hypothetical protein
VAPRAASVSACKLVRQEQFLYSPVLKCMYLNFLQLKIKKKKFLLATKVLSYDPNAGQGHLSYDPHGVRKLQSEPRCACLWT